LSMVFLPLAEDSPASRGPFLNAALAVHGSLTDTGAVEPL
jgi:hypothetical protein